MADLTIHKLDSYLKTEGEDKIDMKEVLEDLFGGNGDNGEKFHDFQLLDEVLSEFVDTAMFRGVHPSLSDIIQTVKEERTPRYYRFTHAAIPYIGTVDLFRGTEFDTINIRLPNDRFQYVYKHGARFKRHRYHGWIDLDEAYCLRYMPKTAKL